MTYLQLAQLIPDKFRARILAHNHIFKAVLEFHDFDMMQLWFYWANFIEPGNPAYTYTIRDGKIVVANEQQCKICLSQMHNKWILLEPYLVLLELESNMLKEL